jgi:DNA-binding Lrp family transcriptional regulator
LKDSELKLISELMKNSRRSDRELAKAIGVSQPTVSRMIKKLEEEGIIREYTMIPDFSKLGYGILAITFASTKLDLTSEELKKARGTASEFVSKNLPQVVMYERLSLGNTVTISYHKSYSDFVEFTNLKSHYSFVNVESVQSHLVDLKDPMRTILRPITFSPIAQDILTIEGKQNRIIEAPKIKSDS